MMFNLVMKRNHVQSVQNMVVMCPMWASMWSGDVCNALNSSLKLAVMQQTSNTLIIDGSLFGAAVLYQCANKMRNK